MDRILLLMAAPDYASADTALRSARDSAAAPERISYGLSLQEEPDKDDCAAMRALGSVQFLCPGGDSWSDVEELWQGEGYVLIAGPGTSFTRHWDMQLLRALRQCRRDSLFSAVLTGYLPRPQDPVDAVCPVAADRFGEDGSVCFHRGTPLRYAERPLRSAFIHPDFCFAPAGFFREMLEEDGPLFLAAFRRKWEVYTLHRPLLHALYDMPVPSCPPFLAEEGAVPGLIRFEKRFSLRFSSRQLSAMARQGVFTADLTFPVHVPYAVRAQEALREVMGARRKSSPLCVTAFLSLPLPGANLREQYLCWFGYLSGLKNLPLLCYGDGETTRLIVPRHPNVLEYKRRYGLPIEGDIPPEEAMNFIRLCKPFILAQSREKFLHHSHYIWMDFGYLRYPVYERAAIEWDNLCGDTITLATVDGEPDLSMLVVPDRLVLTLCREIAALCNSRRNAGQPLPLESELWRTLMAEHPDWFRTVALPGPRELLTLTMMSREEEAHVYA